MGVDLKFRQDGTFTIVQFTDMHIGDDKEEDRERDGRTAALVKRIIASEKPDLVVLTGDMIWSHGVPDPKASFRRAIAPVVASQVPWAAVFGNHDAEAGVSREELLAIQQENESCLSVAGPADLSGIGNYVLTVKSGDEAKNAAALYFFDSGINAPESIGGYDWIKPDQVYWYTRQSVRLAELAGHSLPSLAFFHIPVPEYEEAWRGERVEGVKEENVESPKINSGLFAAMVQMGDVMGAFVGHDHDNDYCGTLHGIRLCYGRVSGYNCYGKLRRGARVIRLTEGKKEFETWIAEADGGMAP
ncbi:metallophosphoesterase family protein [Paenibacillus sp. LHD-117]|uniref:metallophosphoesterase family protein n=1 Tax=Paenibacillus sp. LHD-117 TaxID=3071412 RepID=UPI0027E16D87|nr:metallophosphoesterase family protein [Paenibacillus sp. LHD-117]MDQ6422308.1 metallophosphoesterase family protein [Paenibacillus sp. LHD-117]